MHKLITFSALTLSALLLGGCQMGQKTATAEPSPSPSVNQEKGSNALSDIAAKVMAGGTYRCTFVDPESKQEMSYVVQGKKVSMTMKGGMSQTQSDSRMLSDGTTVYIWDTSSKKGMKMTAPDPKEMESLSQSTSGSPATLPDFSDPAEIEKLQQEYQIDCQPSSAAAEEFAAPTDVEFQDMSQLMQMMQQSQTTQP